MKEEIEEKYKTKIMDLFKNIFCKNICNYNYKKNDKKIFYLFNIIYKEYDRK